MFTKKVKHSPMEEIPPKRGRGRPRGRTPEGVAAARSLYKAAIQLITERGYEGTTLRDIADRAGVSVGLLYRYFPSKRAIVLTFYDELSAEYASRASEMEEGKWRDRCLFAITTSLSVLSPYRDTLAMLIPALVGDSSEGIFAPATAFSRHRVQGVFQNAVVGASDAPSSEVAEALARLLYLLHLAIILCWLFDRSQGQRATAGLAALFKQAVSPLALALRLHRVRKFVLAGDKLIGEALFENASIPSSLQV